MGGAGEAISVCITRLAVFRTPGTYRVAVAVLVFTFITSAIVTLQAVLGARL